MASDVDVDGRPTPSDAVLEALVRLRGRMGADWSPMRERDLIEALPLRRREQAQRRLLALEPLVGGRTAPGAVAEVARAAGVGRRNFHRLLAELRRMSPSAVLGGGGRNLGQDGAGPGSVGATMGGGRDDARMVVIEDAIRMLILVDPDARLATFVRRVEEACRAAGVKPPVALTVARRLDTIRSEEHGNRARSPVGARVLVDVSAVSLAISERGVLHRGVVRLIIDQGSRLILGCGLGRSGALSEASTAVMADLVHRRPAIRGQTVVSGALSDMTWVAPDASGPSAVTWRRRMKAVGAEGEIVAPGPQRYGVRLRRLLGPALGPLRFAPRRTDDRELLSVGEAQDLTVLASTDAARFVASVVDRWNARIIDATEDGGGRKNGAGGSPAGRDALDDIASALAAEATG